MEVSNQLHAPAVLPPSTHWIGGWVVPRAGLETVVKTKIPSLLKFNKNQGKVLVFSCSLTFVGFETMDCIRYTWE